MQSETRHSRPALAVVCNSLPPYRIHAHERFAAEIPELRLLTINTHVDGTRDWQVNVPESLGLVDLSEGDRVSSKHGISQHRKEWHRGSRIIDRLKNGHVAAVVVNGYNDLGRLRAIRWCLRNKVPVFIWADSNVYSESQLPATKRWVKHRFISSIVRKVTGVFGCGERGRQYWKLYGARDDQIFISPYEPDYDQIRNIDGDEIAAAKKRHGLADARRLIVFSGRLIGVKRVDLLIDAFASIAHDRPEWDVVIMGDGELRSHLQARVPSQLADRFHWLGFQFDQREVSRIYRGGDLLVLPSEYEPWALVINEAVAAGMAVLASDAVAAAVELVENGKNGYRFPVGDIEALTDCLRKATDAEQIDRLKSESAGALEAWQERGDPVQGLRKALHYAGVLTQI